MTHEAYRPETFQDHISRLIEECAEVIQCCTKIQRFGAGNYHPGDPKQTRNLYALEAEISDLGDAVRDFRVWLETNSDDPILDEIKPRLSTR